MLLKLIVFILLIAMLSSLFTGFWFLVKDKGNERKRVLYALLIRISLATALIGTIAYGIGTGQLGSQAPWDRELHPERVINE
jgi:succinate dehydrogenase/fumarate reductase cytochrome b subunit